MIPKSLLLINNFLNLSESIIVCTQNSLSPSTLAACIFIGEFSILFSDTFILIAVFNYNSSWSSSFLVDFSFFDKDIGVNIKRRFLGLFRSILLWRYFVFFMIYIFIFRELSLLYLFGIRDMIIGYQTLGTILIFFTDCNLFIRHCYMFFFFSFLT